MTPAQSRIRSAPLRAIGAHVRVASDQYHVATVSRSMNDPEEYARLFAAAPDMQDVLLFIEGHAIMDQHIWRNTWPEWTEMLDKVIDRWKVETNFGAHASPNDSMVHSIGDATLRWCFLPLTRAALSKIDCAREEQEAA